jgi:hypothetical protein
MFDNLLGTFEKQGKSGKILQAQAYLFYLKIFFRSSQYETNLFLARAALANTRRSRWQIMNTDYILGNTM